MLDLKYILTQRWGVAFGRGFPLMSWQEEIFEREKITPNAIGLFKRFSNINFPNESFVVESTKDGKTSKTKIKSWVNPNETLVIKESF